MEIHDKQADVPNSNLRCHHHHRPICLSFLVGTYVLLSFSALWRFRPGTLFWQSAPTARDLANRNKKKKNTESDPFWKSIIHCQSKFRLSRDEEGASLYCQFKIITTQRNMVVTEFYRYILQKVRNPSFNVNPSSQMNVLAQLKEVSATILPIEN